MGPILAALICTGYLTVDHDSGLTLRVSFVTDPGPAERVTMQPDGPAYIWHVSSLADTFVALINLGGSPRKAVVHYHAPDASQLAQQDLDVAPGMSILVAGAAMPACRNAPAN
jgi:hypothetical protein